MSDKHNSKIDSFEVSLYNLFCSENEVVKVDAIRIPMIQRDYAQGRPEKADLRKNFLNTLYAAIDESDAKPCVLDFIYGQRYKNSQPEETIFEPIDGQQRLTTLFLLHLYVAKQIVAHEPGFNDYKWLIGFSYQTRESSKRFCKELIEMPAEAFNDLKSYLNSTPWYTRRYKSDPTIAGMIQTLSDIAGHYKFRHEDTGYMKQVWERLKTNITFMLLYIKDLQTTDDLYIKMNSRGLFLTQFEQFKAELEGYFKDVTNTQELNFGVKIDTLWTNLLWDYRKKKQDGINADFKTYDGDNRSPYAKNGLDEKFHHLFRRFMTMEGFKCDLFYEYAEEDEKPELREYKDNPNENLLSLAKNVFKDVPIEEKEKRMLRLCRFLDGVYKNSLKDGVCNQDCLADFFGKYLYGGENTEESYSKIRLFNGEVDQLKAFCSASNLGNLNSLILEAFIEYFSTNIAEEMFVERLRIVRNLAVNTYLRNISGAIKNRPL